MWKRDQQLLDVYSRKGFPGLQQKQHSRDDSIIVQTKSLYTLPSMSHSQPLLEVYTRNVSSTCVYKGNEFDVFNSNDSEAESIIQPPQLQQPQQQPLLQPQSQLQPRESESTSSLGSIKRKSISYLIDNNDVKKRRTTTTSMEEDEEEEETFNNLSNDKSVINGSVFIKSTAPANTPANIFMKHPEAEQSSYDLEYY